MPASLLAQQFNSVFNTPCFNSQAADRYAHQLDEEQARQDAIDSLVDQMTGAAFKGDYLSIHLDDIQEIEADTNEFWQLTAQLREAVCSGKTDNEVMLIVHDLVGMQKSIITSIAIQKAPAALRTIQEADFQEAS